MRKMLTLAITLFMASAAPRLAAADDETFSAIEPDTDPDPQPTPEPDPDPAPPQPDVDTGLRTDHFQVFQTDDRHGQDIWHDETD